MKQYIDKDALVAWAKETYLCENASMIRKVCYKQLLEHLDTLEVKEVNLEHEVESYWKQCDMTWCRDAYSMTHIRSMLSDFAKHFFELGLQAQKGEDI